MVEDVAELLGGPDIAIDERHGPMMYSRFLKGLLEMPQADVDHSPTSLKRAQRLSPEEDDSVARQGLESPIPPVEISPPSPQPGQRMQPASVDDSQMFDGLQYGEHFGSQPVNAAELCSPPLPFDADMVQSMQQSLASTPWSIIMPGKLSSYGHLYVLTYGSFRRVQLDGRYATGQRR